MLELCEQILDRLAESREIERRDFELSTTEYNNGKEKFGQMKLKLNGEIARLTKRINQLQIRLDECKSEIRS